MYLWQLCGNLWQREEKCGKGCGNVAILLYICVNKKRHNINNQALNIFATIATNELPKNGFLDF